MMDAKLFGLFALFHPKKTQTIFFQTRKKTNKKKSCQNLETFEKLKLQIHNIGPSNKYIFRVGVGDILIFLTW
jgi:hypothetical protein